jgi:hypothetical protein
MSATCNICNANSNHIFSCKILGKYDVNYYKCNRCGFIQTESPYWLNEAYSSAITAQDLGLIYRNNLYAPLVGILIKLFYNKSAKFLDFGGGYGMFVRLMRDRGFDFFRHDSYCQNLFAPTFEHSDTNKYELITAFEVFEHLASPIEEIEFLLNKSKNILFSTELQPDKLSNEKDWWYVMPKTGQHISLFTLGSLEYIAKKYNLNLYSNGKNLHLLTDRKINRLLFKLAINRYSALILDKIIPSPQSLLMSDYYKIADGS